ncbi:MAG: prolyl oligopeptidase family serine peptidase [Gemmatimonadota bacterium]
MALRVPLLRGYPALAPCAGAALLFLAPVLQPDLAAQSPEAQRILHAEGYLQPPDQIAEAVRAPRHENVLLDDLSPARDFFLSSRSPTMLALEDLARPYHRLGGVEIDPVAQRSRNLTTRGSTDLHLVSAETGEARPIRIPEGVRVTGVSWSPDGTRVAFLGHHETESYVYAAEVTSAEARRLGTTPLLATRVTDVEWSGDGRHLFAVVRPAGQAEAPPPPATPTTPLIRLTTEAENRLRTYPSLLRDPHEKELLEYFLTGQLVRIGIESGEETPIGSPAMFESISPSPSGEHVRVERTVRPFPYIVPVSMFGSVEEIWDVDGRVLVELDRSPVRDGVEDDDDDDEGDPERRAITWRPDGHGLSFLQRDAKPEPRSDDEEEEEDEEEEASRPDRVMHWLPPFDEESLQEVYENEREIRELRYSSDASILFITERERDTETVYAVFADEPEERLVVSSQDTEDWYDAPGSLMTRPNSRGVSVVRTSENGRYVYLSGTEHFEDNLTNAPRPFVDRVELRTGEVERIFRSAEDAFEQVAAVLDDDLERLVVTRETPTDVPDSWLLDRDSGERVQLTHNVDPTPDLTAARREVLEVVRADGKSFRVQVTLPADHVEGERLPAVFWFYPREYDDQESYDESNRDYNLNRFPRLGVRSMEILTRHGYAVVQPDHPTFGPRTDVNDSFIPDLRANLLAVIDAVDARGWVDRSRLALGGHSYGGFGTIHALVQTPYFRAGIAGAPNSNRLLTPLGFQSERRNLWDARETYLEMSPFLWADRMSGALLIYHGEEDQNTGTFPDNSWRLIHALNGLGKTAALYMYPYEAHGQVAEATLLDMWARWVAWLDHYVKEADTSQPVAPILVEDEAVDGELR